MVPFFITEVQITFRAESVTLPPAAVLSSPAEHLQLLHPLLGHHHCHRCVPNIRVFQIAQLGVH